LLPSRDRRFRGARWLCLAAILLVSSLPVPAAATEIAAGTDAHAPAKSGGNSGNANVAGPAADTAVAVSSDETLLLEVERNGQSTGKIGEFVMRGGKLMARASELRDLGFRIPDVRGASPDRVIALSDLPGVTFTIDQVNQVLHVIVAESSLAPTILQPPPRDQGGDHRVIESGTGVTLNYDVINTLASGQTGATGSFDTRLFSPAGIVSSDWLAYAGNNSNAARNGNPVRLDSVYTFADVNTLRRYSVGDFITGDLSWSRPVRLAGLQVRSDFSMRPDLITFPMPSIKGTAAVPSSVDVLTDGNLVASGQIGSGPFEVPQLPVMSGAGTITLAMTNAMGQRVVTQPFYASSALLAPGLQTFSVQAGAVRRNWGSASYDYGKFAGIGNYRRGLTPNFTIEGTAEGTPGTFVAGGGGVTQIGTIGVLNYSAAGSFGSGRSGGQVSAGAQRIGREFSLGASATIASHDYWDVAAMNGNGILRRQVSAFTSVSFRRFGTAGGAYAGVSQDPSPRPLTTGGISAQSSHIVSANYSVQIHHMSFYASLFKTLDDSSSTGLQVGLTIPFRRRSSVDISGSSDGYGQIDVQKSVTDIGDWGYQAYVSAGGGTSHEFAQVAHKALKGLFIAGIDSNAGATTAQLESQGALSFADGGLFLSNWVYDSFAIVDTNPMRHVEVLQENRSVGKTGSSGKLLVADMRSFDLNHLTIEANDLPADVNVHDSSREVRPQDRSGVVVKFAMKFSHGALLHLVDESGAAVPLGSSARLQATGVVVPVGYDGEAYVEDLSPHNALSVERPDGRRCRVVFDYHPVPGEIPSIGPLRCVEANP
jgi:outer membrane usher protein